LQINHKLPYKQLSDEILITRVARGDPIAFEILYDRYAATILGVCLKIIHDQTEAEEHYRKHSGRFGKGQLLMRPAAVHLQVGSSGLHEIWRWMCIVSAYRNWTGSEQRLVWKMNSPRAYSMVVN